MEYTLVRSNRRTAVIYILPDARVEVRVPRNMSGKVIDSLVSEKQQWINKKLEEARRRLVQRQAFSLKDGDTLPYKGCEFPVRASQDDRLLFDGASFAFPASFLTPTTDWTICKPLLIELYKRLTLPLVQARVPRYAELLRVQPTAIKVSSAVKRWGSCSGKNSLNFSWMLAAADNNAIDYVVVHELCHICEHNHSSAFWRLVQSVLPDYKQREILLRDVERRISLWG